MKTLEYPLPPGLYVFYDSKERRGWWAGKGNYTIWPGQAAIYTADEANEILKRGSPYVEVGTAADLGLSCLDFAHNLLLKQATQ